MLGVATAGSLTSQAHGILAGMGPGLAAGPAGPGSGAAVRGAVVLALVVGAAFAVAVAAGAVAGARSLARLPGGRVALILLAAILAVLCVLATGAPVWNGDEILNLSSSLTAVFTNLDLVTYPNPALFYQFQAGLAGLAAGVVALVHGGPIEDAAMRIVAFHPTAILVASRCATALAWTGVLGVAYASVVTLCRRPWAGYAAIGMLAATNLAYQTAGLPYAAGVLFAMLAVHHVVVARPEAPVTPGWAAVAGAWAGVALASHYLAALLLVPLAAAVFARRWPRPVASLAAFAGTAALAFLILNPRLVPNLSGYLAFARYRLSEVGHFDAQNAGPSAPTAGAGPLYYAGLLFPRAVAWIALAGLPGAVLDWRATRDARVAAVILLPLGLLAFFTLVATKYNHYLLFASPPLAVLGAAGVAWALERPVLARGRAWIAAAVLAVAALDAGVVTADTFARSRPWPGLLAEAPEAIFLRRVADLPPGQRVGFTSPDLALPRLAATSGLLPASAIHRFGRVVDEAAGREIDWVDAPAEGLVAARRAGIPWLYTVEWGVTAPRASSPPPPGSVLAWSRLAGGLFHSLFRIGQDPGGGAPDAVPPPPGGAP